MSVAAAPGRTDELFIAEKPGRLVRWTPSGTSEVLDIRDLVADVSEQGLLPVAVAPDYATSGRLFIFYTDNEGDLQVDEYHAGTRTPVLTIQHDQASNHNGGQLLFGPDNALRRVARCGSAAAGCCFGAPPAAPAPRLGRA